MNEQITTRLPESRHVEGLEYGRHVSGNGWSGYFVRPADSYLPMKMARLTPAGDELEGDDDEIVAAIEAELYEVTSTAEQVAAAFLNDGQRWTHPVSGDDLSDYCERQGGVAEYARRGAGTNPNDPGSFYVSPSGADHLANDPVRYVFQDGSAIVATPGGWDIEGSEPFSWEGAE